MKTWSERIVAINQRRRERSISTTNWLQRNHNLTHTHIHTEIKCRQKQRHKQTSWETHTVKWIEIARHPPVSKNKTQTSPLLLFLILLFSCLPLFFSSSTRWELILPCVRTLPGSLISLDCKTHTHTPRLSVCVCMCVSACSRPVPSSLRPSCHHCCYFSSSAAAAKLVNLCTFPAFSPPSPSLPTMQCANVLYHPAC